MLLNAPEHPLVAETHGADNAVSIPRALRRDLLLAATRLTGWFGVPLLVVFVTLAWRAGRPVRWLALELTFMVAAALAGWLGARASVRNARRVFTTAFGFCLIFTALQFGPSFVVGVLYIGWLLAFVFFERHWMLATAVGSTGFLAVGFLAVRGLVSTSWASNGPTWTDWLQMSLVVAVVSAVFGFMLDRVLDDLEASLRSEIAARTAEAAAQADREAAFAALTANQHIESLGRLAGGVAHDFNNALGVLALGIDSLETDADATERAQSIELMQRALRGARETTTQLLSFSRQGSEPGSLSDPSAVVLAMAKSLVRLLPASIRIVTESTAVGRVEIGVGELEQALLNLCLNARDAMDGEGTLTLRTRTVAADPSTLVIEVEDTGSGMSAEVRRHALEPFFTTKEVGRGTGLGLAMVSATVRRANGSLEIVSEPGRGTTIRLLLPLADDRAREPIAEASSSSVPRVFSILYVEDEPSLVRMTARALGRAGHQVEIATTVAEGLARLANDPLPDLLLTDARLPDGSSARVIREFRRRAPGAPVILCSGYVDDDAMVGGIERDSVLFLQKPYGIKVLTDAVERALE